jgi:hypothetical protein
MTLTPSHKGNLQARAAIYVALADACAMAKHSVTPEEDLKRILGGSVSSFAEDAKKALGSLKAPSGPVLYAIVDGDIVAYRAAAATQGTSYDVEHSSGLVVNFKYHKMAVKNAADSELAGVPTCTITKRVDPEPLHHATSNLEGMMRGIRSNLEQRSGRPVELVTYLTADVLWREDILPSYKQNRVGTERPKNLKGCKEYLEKNHSAVTVAGYEADDLMIIKAHSLSPDDCVIVSLDKDLRQYPGMHYDFVSKKRYVVSEQEARINFWSQTLTGDATDNIPGIYGVGPKTAEKILSEFTGASTDWEIYKKVLDTWLEKTPHLKDEGKRAFATRVMGLMGTSAKLLWLSRSMGDLWDVPNYEVSAVSGDINVVARGRAALMTGDAVAKADDKKGSGTRGFHYE